MVKSIATRRRALGAGLLAALLFGGGCAPATAPVEGTLKLNGTPLADIEVYFVPDGEQGTRGPRAAAVTDAAGHFTLDLGSSLGKGALVGNHRVVLIDKLAMSTDPRDGGPQRAPKPSRVPEAYTAATTTPLRTQVEAGAKTIDLEITSP